MTNQAHDPASLSKQTLSRLQTALCLKEVAGGLDFPAGEARVFAGAAQARIVYIRLSVAPIGLDSHLIFAFADPETATPHFTLDAVKAPPAGYAFHLDLVPRVDLGEQLSYMDAVYAPLSDIFSATSSLPGLSPAHLSPRQRALMSPWMLAHHATEPAFGQIAPAVDAYLTRFLDLVASPPALPDGVEPASLRLRDRRNRQALFSPAVDPVWPMVARLVGQETAEALRALLLP